MIVRSRRRLQHGLTALAVSSTLVLGGVALAGAANAAPPSYEPDANAVGTVTLYDAGGAQITSGSTTAHPFAAYFAASGGNTPGSPAGSSGATAIAATPRDGVNSQNWSNDTLSATTDFGPTASASYPGSLKNSTKAIAKTTSTDFSLNDYIGEYPAASTTDPGVYQIRVVTGNPVNFYSMDVKVTGSTWTQVYPAAATPTQMATTTAVTANPASPSTVGTSVTFTATVSPSAAAGAVQFKDGTTDLGTPRTVTGGTATYSTTALTAGAHSITAAFVPTDTAAYTGSTSPSVTYNIATVTTTALTVTPTSPAAANTQEVLSATVAPNTATGTIIFKDGTTTIGSAQPVSGGTASTTATLEPGPHSLTAVFTPTSAATYTSSTSTVVTYTVKGSTTTTVGATPPSPQTPTASIAFSATVSPKVAGSVQFKDGAANLGSAVSVAAGSGSAVLPATTLSKGTHPITAVFTPTDAANYSASTSAPLQYVIAEAPGAPTGVSAKPVNETATVSWTAPSDNGGTPIVGYDVQYSVDGTTWTGSAVAARTSTATTAVVTGLRNGTAYLFRVRTLNGVGGSSFDQTTTKVSPVADASVVSISATRSVYYGGAATVSTVVSDARDHSRLARVPVALYRRVAGASRYSYVRTVITSASGTAAYRLTLGANTALAWTFSGNAAHKAAGSRGVTVTVVPRVSISAKTRKVKHGKSIEIYGGASPAPSGERVYLQQLLKGKWHTLVSTTIHRQKLPNGRTATGYAFSRTLSKKGSYSFRVATAATSYSLAGASGRLTARAT